MNVHPKYLKIEFFFHQINSFGSFGGLSTIDRKNQKKSIKFFCEKQYLSCFWGFIEIFINELRDIFFT